MKRLLGIILVWSLFPIGASAQDAVCYVQWQGQFIDLTNTVCGSSTPTKSDPLPVSKFRFSDLSIVSARDGNSVEVKGTITNDSSKVSSLSMIRFNIINQRGQILTTDTAIVNAGSGLSPGEQLSFSKAISLNTLGANTNTSDLRVEVIGSG